MSENCHVDPTQKTPTSEELNSSHTTFLAIYGMGCPNCAARVRNSVLSLYGVSGADVDHQAGMGRVVFNPDLTTVTAIIDAVAQAGVDGRHEYGAALLA